jgi:hypothetical protein
MYSVSKSFTSTAIGFAVSENKLKVTDKVVSFFPDQLPDSVSDFLAEMTIKDLLTMSAGHEKEPTRIATDTNWVKDFLAWPVPNKPGTKFLYNSLATYMLSAIVQKVTGEKMIGYLQPRLFTPLGISGMDWEEDPKGINTGGWGLRVKTEDMARLGQLYLQKGKWNSKQLLPEQWTEVATRMHIDQGPSWSSSISKDSSDWNQGYGYQFWRSRHNSYRGDGAFGQYILVMPEKDAVIAITSYTHDMQDQINYVWKYLLPAIQPGELGADRKKSRELKKMLSGRSLLPPVNNASAPGKIKGKTFPVIVNEYGIRSISFTGKRTISVEMQKDSLNYTIPFAEGKWSHTSTAKPVKQLFHVAKTDFAKKGPFRISSSYAWKDPGTIQLVLRYIESPHKNVYTLLREGDQFRVAEGIE